MTTLSQRNDAAINGLNAVFGIVLLISPWLFDFSVAPVATGTAATGGIVIAIVAFAAFMQLLEWEEWVSLVAGLCIMLAPWLLVFAGMNSATWVHAVIGFAVAGLAAIELRRLHQPNPPSIA